MRRRRSRGVARLSPRPVRSRARSTACWPATSPRTSSARCCRAAGSDQPLDVRVEPWLAERWESSADGLTHTFHLRPNLTWSDGAPFTSADVLFSLEAALDPKVKSVMAAA
jgi:ABC-type transport system substrate-binding protein